MKFLGKLFGKGSKVGGLPKLDRQKKICYPGHDGSGFASLSDAVQYFRKNGSNMEYRIRDLIMYNICYRDYLRNYGIEMLLKRLVADVPDLSEDMSLLQSLRKWYDEEGKELAGYDIQCYNIRDTITVLGHKFQGLGDLIAHTTAYARIGHSDISISSCSAKKKVPGLYVSEFYATYPIFDSYEIGDGRTYQNYVFTSEPIDDEQLKEISQIRHNYNYCMVHEHIPEKHLPILYYRGDGDYMVLAQKK